MTTYKDRYEERKAQEEMIAQVKVGDELILTTNGRHETTRKLVTVARLTAKQLVLEDKSKFWFIGDHALSEVGNASRDWRRSYMSASRRVSVSTSDKETAEVRTEIEARRIKAEALNLQAKEARKVKHDRRATRYEGTLDRYKNRVDELLADDPENETLKRMSSQLYDFIWRLEDNEKSLQMRIESERDDLKRLAEYLENDLNTSFRTDYRIEEALTERKQLIETSKHVLSLVRTVTGSLESEDDS